MSWQEEYRAALKKAVWNYGRPVRDATSRDLYYGWTDYEILDHFYVCPLGSASEPEEDKWDEFVDTFYEGDTTRHGVSMKAQCACGQINQTIRWRCRPFEMVQLVLAREKEST